MTSVQEQTPAAKTNNPSTNLHDISTVSDLLKDAEAQLKQAYKDYANNEYQLIHYQNLFFRSVQENRKRDYPDDHPQGEDPNHPHHPPRSKQKTDTETVNQLREELTSINNKLEEERKENAQLSSNLEARTKAMKSDAKELQSLRSQNATLQDANRKIIALESDLKATELRADREMKDSHNRISIETENNALLREEIGRLSKELTKSRFENEVTGKENTTALKNATELSKTYARDLAQTKTQNKQMEEYIQKIEEQLETVKQESEQDKKSFEEERARLTKINQLQKDLTKEAEQRATDFQEILKSVQQEMKSKEKEQQQQGPGLNKHAEVLLENMQKTLDARMNLLHGQRQEMERAQSSEMKLLAKQENLVRQAQTAQWEAEEARKEVSRLQSLLEERNRAVVQLEGRLSAAASPSPMTAQRESQGRHSIIDPEIGPRSIIPIDYQRSRQSSEWATEATGAIDELQEIRNRHQRLLENIRNRRASQI